MTAENEADDADRLIDAELKIAACEKAIQALAPWLEPEHFNDALATLRVQLRKTEKRSDRMAAAIAIYLISRSPKSLEELIGDVDEWRR